ncbi:pyridoxamine 5'-phosphate oxidase family protein [Nocardioides sp.]|uniref:pyridoxamine 5'-phosphate oxidase family protein n=1 Tax=Nocardioides sp. TaxID=35761 RepID=UPI002EDB537A
MTEQQLSEDQPMVELTVEECWDLLAGAEVGRLAYRLVDEIHLVPINYAVEDRVILFRTAAGNKLLAAEMESEVAFEIDWVGEDSAWSVLARGHLRHLDESEEDRLSDLQKHPWVPSLKYDHVALAPAVVTGRRFLLSRD